MSLIYRILAAWERGQAKRKHLAAARHLAHTFDRYEPVQVELWAAVNANELAIKELKNLTGERA